MQALAESYQIRKAKTPILLAIVGTADLKPHEETIQSHLRTIVDLLKKDPVLHHPIVTDKKTGLVLDGNHRLEAIKKLGCKLAPCAMVDYQNDKIQIDRWFRSIEGTTLDKFKILVQPIRNKYEAPTRAEILLENRACYATIDDGRSYLMFPTSIKDPVRLTQASFKIERIARSAKLKVGYVGLKGRGASGRLLLSPIRLTKQEVLQAVNERKTFPPKTTRHIIPSRPLGLRVPLGWLRGRSRLREQRRFLKLLHGMRVTRMPPGSRFGSRQYEEEIFVFE